MNIWKRYSMRVSKNWVKFNKMFTLSPWIGNGQPKTDLKHYSLVLAYQNGLTSIVKFLEVNDDKQ